jgi:hypothetical protein
MAVPAAMVRSSTLQKTPDINDCFMICSPCSVLSAGVEKSLYV